MLDEHENKNQGGKKRTNIMIIVLQMKLVYLSPRHCSILNDLTAQQRKANYL